MSDIIYDEVKISNNMKIRKSVNESQIGISPEMGEILFSQKVKKINDWHIRQERTIIMTGDSMFNFKGEQMQRKIKLANISGLSISNSSEEVVVHIKNEKDYRLCCVSEDSRDIFMKHLLLIYNKYIYESLRVYTMEDKSLEIYTSRKKDEKLPDCNYQNLTASGWLKYIELKQVNRGSKSQSYLLFSRHSRDVKCQDFRVLNMLGEGLISKLYLVEWMNYNRLYVLKVLDKHSLSQYGTIEKDTTDQAFKNHRAYPFLEQLEFAFQNKNAYFIYLKFYPQGDLFYHVSQSKYFSEERARFYFIELACLLGMLHEKGQVYRDLTLENILVDDEGHLVLTDFGIARGIKFKAGELDSIITTPEYTPPEVLSGITKKEYSRMADWWCLGLILYEMVIGVPPFQHPSQPIMFTLIQQAIPYIPPDTISPDCTSMLLALLDKSPSDRIGNNTDLDDLKAHRWMSGVDWDQVKHKRNTPFWLNHHTSRRQSLTQSMMIKFQNTDQLQSHKQDLGKLLTNFDEKLVRRDTLDFHF